MSGPGRALLLRGGRVIDPGTGQDAVADVLVVAGRVAALGQDVAGRQPGDDVEVLDASGLVVGPGFVDLHSHTHTIAGHRLQALDGVTTALDLEAGLLPVDRAYAEASEQGRPLHFGFSASWSAARAQVLLGLDPVPSLQFGLDALGVAAWQASSTPAQLTRWLDLLERDLRLGALGIGVLQGYAPDCDPSEYLEVARLAARAGAPTYTHVRDLAERGSPTDGPTEVAAAAAATGAAMHHCHVNSTSGRHVERVLATLRAAQDAGARVSTEFYPYGSGSTGIGAAFLDPDRLATWGLRPSSIVLLSTGERISTESRLRELRADSPGELCVLEVLDERDPTQLALLLESMTFPDSIVASDAVPVSWPRGLGTGPEPDRRVDDTSSWPLPPGGVTHPRTAGTFTKALRMMVRERGAWTWLEAFRRCSWLPARVLDDVAPDARRKGHLGVGADADVVVLDAARVTDRADYAQPTRPAEGVRHLLVGGVPLVRDGHLDAEVLPGRPLRGAITA